jgi:hypothetical protein
VILGKATNKEQKLPEQQRRKSKKLINDDIKRVAGSCSKSSEKFSSCYYISKAK